MGSTKMKGEAAVQREGGQQECEQMTTGDEETLSLATIYEKETKYMNIFLYTRVQAGIFFTSKKSPNRKSLPWPESRG